MSSGGGQSSTVTTRELSPEQRKLIEPVIPVAEDFLKNPPKLFPGSAISGFNPTQTSAQNQALQGAGTVSGIAGDAADTLKQTQGLTPGTTNSLQNLMGRTALSGGFDQQVFGNGAGSAAGGARGLGDVVGDFNATSAGRNFLTSGALLDPRTNPVLGSQIQGAIRPVFDNLQRSVLPGIRSDFLGGNMFGSSRQGIAEGLAIGDASRSALDTAANLQANNFNQGLGVMSDQIGQAAQLGTQAGSTLAQLGSQNRGQDINAATSSTNSALDNILRSLFASGDVGNLALLPAGITGAVGAEQQGLDQARLSEQSQRFTTEQMLPFLAAQDVAALGFGIPAGSTSSTGQGPQTSRFGGIGSLLGMGAGALIGGPFGATLGGAIIGGGAGRTLGDLF